MQSKEQSNLIFIRLFPEEDVYDCLKKSCQKHQVKTAVVLSGLGQLGRFELGFFKKKGDYTPEKFKEPYELLCLTGAISCDRTSQAYDFHLHAVLGNEQKKTIGGHFISGKVSITGEIVLLKTELPVKRIIEESSGLKGLFLE